MILEVNNLQINGLRRNVQLLGFFLCLFLLLDPSLSIKRAPEGVEDSPLTFISALMGSKVSLTCEVTPPVPDDRAILVLFYKGGIGTPIYSIDAREGEFDHGSQWIDEAVLGSRAYFDTRETLLIRPGLILDPVQLKDDAQYRCRVDFMSSPTRNARIQLQVVDPPKRLKILNEAGNKVEGAIGPFASGSKVVLKCQVEGGFPRPYVSWWRNSILTDDESEQNTENITSNILTLTNLTRKDLFASLTCHGSNSNLTSALTSSVTIDMIFRPLELQLIGGEEPQVEGSLSNFMCEAKGSRPPAEISWWKNGQMLSHAVTKTYNNGNITRSSIELAVTREYDKAQVICRAQNLVIPSAVLEASRKLEVFYPPTPKLSPGMSLNIEEIKEGDDIFFECKIEANPPTSVVEWYFNEDKRLVQNLTSGVIESNQSLVLQKVGRKATGKYNCHSRNKYGEGVSNFLQLRVKYSPVCVTKSPKVFGAEKNERMSVSCNVEADPPPTQFEWAFNTSTEVVDMTWFKGHIGQEVSYTPRSDLDFGSLLCWASNEVGTQKIPCVIHVIHAGIPSPVRNCTAVNVSSCCASIECLPGWNGGLEQSFTIEVLEDDQDSSGLIETKLNEQEKSKITTRGGDTDSMIVEKGAPLVLANTATSPHPVFVVEGLNGGRKYLVSIRAVNAKGHSEESFLTVLTNEEEHQRRVATEIEPSETNQKIQVTPLVATAVGILGSFLLFIFLSGFILWKRRSSHERKDKSRVELISAGSGSRSSSRELQILDRKSSLHDIDCGTPDIIPSPKEENQSLCVTIEATKDLKVEALVTSQNRKDPSCNTSHQDVPHDRSWKDSHSLPILRPTESSQVNHGLDFLPPPPISFSYFPSFPSRPESSVFSPCDIPPEGEFIPAPFQCPQHPQDSFNHARYPPCTERESAL